MYLYLGQDVVVASRDVVAIFDIENHTSPAAVEQIIFHFGQNVFKWMVVEQTLIILIQETHIGGIGKILSKVLSKKGLHLWNPFN